MTEEIRNRILTEFQVSGEQKAEQAVNRLRLHTLAATKAATQQATAQDKIVRAMDALNRQNAYEKIQRGLVAAIRSGADMNDVLKVTAQRLEVIGASQAEVNRLIADSARLAQQASAAQAMQGGGGTRQFLRRAGTELRNLPAMDTPLGVSTDVIGRLTAVVSQFNPVALAATAAGAALAVTVGQMRAGFDAAKASIQKVIEGQQKYHELVITGTRQQLEAELEALQVRRKIAELNLQYAAEQFAKAFENTFSGHAVGNVLQAVAADLGLAEAEFSATLESALEARDALAEVDRELGIYERALGSTEIATKAAAAAEDELATKRQALADQRIQATLSAELAAATMTSDAIEKRLEAINREQAAIFAVVRAGEASVELTNQLTQRQRELTAEVQVLAAALPGKQRAEEAARIFRESVDAVRTHDEAMLKLTESRAEREADIYGKLNDNLVKIAERAADATERTLQQLENRRDDLARDLGRDFRDEQRKLELETLEERIKYQQQEAKSYRDHLRDLRSIREDAQAAEFDLVRNRDFTGLRDLRVETNRRLNEQNRAFIEERKERELAFAENVRDEQRQRQFERESRLLRYQDALDDAQIAAERELAQIQQKRQRELAAQQAAARQELALLNQKHRQEIVMRRDALTAELKLVAQGNAARLRMEEQFLFARAQLYRAGGVFGSLGNFVGGTTNNSSSSFSNTSVFNVQTGGNASQTNQLVSLIENVVQRAFMQYARN